MRSLCLHATTINRAFDGILTDSYVFVDVNARVEACRIGCGVFYFLLQISKCLKDILVQISRMSL